MSGLRPALPGVRQALQGLQQRLLRLRQHLLRLRQGVHRLRQGLRGLLQLLLELRQVSPPAVDEDLRELERCFRQTGSAEDDDPPVAFLFPGQGAQYVEMGRGLYDGLPSFRAHVDECYWH